MRVALAVEGPTDFVFLQAAINSLLPGREIVFQLLQPEYTAAFVPLTGNIGQGWSGVYHWCHQTADEGNGSVSGSSLFRFHDLLVVHLDADVARKTYQSANIEEASQDLPCANPCPPSFATTDALRLVVLRWMREKVVPPRCVLCTPSQNMGAWVIVALWPDNATFKRQGADNWECYNNPEGQFNTVPKADRLKGRRDYEVRRTDMSAGWPAVRAQLSEASRFSEEFLRAAAVVDAAP